MASLEARFYAKLQESDSLTLRQQGYVMSRFRELLTETGLDMLEQDCGRCNGTGTMSEQSFSDRNRMIVTRCYLCDGSGKPKTVRLLR